MCITKKRLLSLLLTLYMVIGLMPSTIFASGSAKETAVAVPSEALVIENGVYYGISKSWFESYNPNGEKLSGATFTVVKMDSETAGQMKNSKKGVSRIIIMPATKHIRINILL